MKVRNWNPAKGDLTQGDVILFRIPDDIKIDTSNEIAPRDNRLILAEGEITGHHHAVWLPQPVMFREDGTGHAAAHASASQVVQDSYDAARVSAANAKFIGDPEAEPVATIKLYRDAGAAEALVRAGQLSHGRLTIGFLVVEGNTVVLRHEEHDACRIPPGRYYVGNQVEWDSAQERKVQD